MLVKSVRFFGSDIAIELLKIGSRFLSKNIKSA
jgi:hypothetical protein